MNYLDEETVTLWRTPSWVGRLCKRDLDRLDLWAGNNWMRFTKANFCALGQNNSMEHHKLDQRGWKAGKGPEGAGDSGWTSPGVTRWTRG